jgi:hypothetical protein
MIHLLIGSLMTDPCLEEALVLAIACEAKDAAVMLKAAEVVPLMPLLRQLLNNASVRQLTFLKQVRGQTSSLLLSMFVVSAAQAGQRSQ